MIEKDKISIFLFQAGSPIKFKMAEHSPKGCTPTFFYAV